VKLSLPACALPAALAAAAGDERVSQASACAD